LCIPQKRKLRINQKVANSFGQNILKVCNILNECSVEYLVVGGIAVAFHGYFRLSHDSTGELADKHDFDFWYNPTYENYFRLLDALEKLELDVKEFREESSPNPKKSFFKLELTEYTIDFLPELPGLAKFRTSFNERIISKIEETAIPVISYKDLITSKQALSRPQDIEDIKQLKLRKDNTE
jgi:hypothetical protein